MRQSLEAKEWIIAISALLLMAVFFLIAKTNARRAAHVIQVSSFRQEEILVTFEGAVHQPGSYAISPGTTLGQALRKARPRFDADLKQLPLDEILIAPSPLAVPSLKVIHVKVRGAIARPVELLLPPDSRISDLKNKLVFTDETDRAFFRRKKRLRDGEEIEVPKKGVE